MRREFSVWTIYHYLVCFVTLMMIVVGTVQLVNGLAELLFPARAQWLTLDQVRYRLGPETSAEMVEAQWKLEQQQWYEDMRYQQLRSIMRSLALVVVALPVYLFHWRRIRLHERSSPEGTPTPPAANRDG